MADAKVTLPSEGRLTGYSLARLLGGMGAVHATGALDIVRKKLVRRFVFDGGRLAVLVSNAREDRLADWLVTHGDLGGVPPEVLTPMLQSLADMPLTGAALLGSGLVARQHMVTLMREHLLAMLTECATWTDATFAIRPGRLPLGAEPSADWPAIAAALHLAREETARSKRPLPLPTLVVSLAPPDALDDPELSLTERDVLLSCTAATEVALLGRRLSSRPFEEVQAALASLSRAGLLVAGERPVPVEAAAGEAPGGEPELTREALERWLAAAAHEDFAGLLGVAPNEDPGSIRRAYYRTVRRFHPDRFREGEFASRHKEVELAFRLVHEALAILTDPVARSDYEARKRKQAAPVRNLAAEAAELFQRAVAAVRSGRRTDAVTLLEQAAGRAPEEPSYALHLSLLLLGNPARRRDAVERLAALARQHAQRADVLAAHALALSKAGQAQEATAAARKAIALDARQPLARALTGDAEGLRAVKEDPFLALLF